MAMLYQEPVQTPDGRWVVKEVDETTDPPSPVAAYGYPTQAAAQAAFAKMAQQLESYGQQD